MFEAQLSRSSQDKPIVTLDGNIVGYFMATSRTGGRNMHVGHIKSIEVTTDKKGKHSLVIISNSLDVTFLDEYVDDELVGKVTEWVGEVRGAIQSLAL
jgi:hypothetical protein